MLREVLRHIKKRREYKKKASLYTNKSHEKSTANKNRNTADLKIVLGYALVAFALTFASYSFILYYRSELKNWALAVVCAGGIVYSQVRLLKQHYLVKTAYWLSVFLALLIMLTGQLTTTYIQNKPVLTNSEGDRVSRLSAKLLSDLLTLEDNQKLLRLNFSQGRGIADLYLQASKQSAQISQKWNPATQKEVPLPGFIDVYSKINRAADTQSQSLAMFYNLLQQRDSKAEERLRILQNDYQEQMYGETGAVRSLQETVRPIGIKLEVKK